MYGHDGHESIFYVQVSAYLLVSHAKISDSIELLNVTEEQQKCLKLLIPQYVAGEIIFYGSG